MNSFNNINRNIVTSPPPIRLWSGVIAPYFKNWINSGASVSTALGSPSINVSSSQYCYTDVKTFIPELTTLKGCTISFDLYTTRLVGFFFACNSLGDGHLFRHETRMVYY